MLSVTLGLGRAEDGEFSAHQVSLGAWPCLGG